MADSNAGGPSQGAIRISVILNVMILACVGYLVLSPGSDITGQVHSMRDELRNLMSGVKADLSKLDTRSLLQSAILKELATKNGIDHTQLIKAAPESLGAIADPKDSDAMKAPESM